MSKSNQPEEKVPQPTGDPGSTMWDLRVEKDTALDLPKLAAAGEAEGQPAIPTASQIAAGFSRLHEACWAVLREPLHAAMTFRLALRVMETLCQLEPTNGPYLLTLGIAQYRFGQYQAALTTLAQSDQLMPGTPASLAFQAMAHHQLGDSAQAHTLFLRLDHLMQQPPWNKNAEAEGFLREAWTLIAAARKVEK